jgi:hypothetical protein
MQNSPLQLEPLVDFERDTPVTLSKMECKGYEDYPKPQLDN